MTRGVAIGPQRGAHRHRHSAFTLIEALVGAAVLALMLGALLIGLQGAFGMSQFTRENLRATQILLDRVEGVRLFNWNQLNYSNWIPATFTEFYYPLTNVPTLSSNDGAAAGSIYTGTMTLTNVPFSSTTTYGSNMLQVNVTVSWTNQGTLRTRTMTTYVAKDGMQNYIFNH